MERSVPAPNLDAILAELARYGTPEPDAEYRTTQEWAALWQCSTRNALILLNRVDDAGQLRHARRSGMSINHRRVSYDVYAIDLPGVTP